MLGVGRVIGPDKNGMVHYLIQDNATIERVLLPIFDKYPLLTCKEYDYLKFKRALVIWNSHLAQTRKTKEIQTLHLEPLPQDYIATS